VIPNSELDRQQNTFSIIIIKVFITNNVNVRRQKYSILFPIFKQLKNEIFLFFHKFDSFT